MNRLLSFFKRRLSRPTSSSFFSTNNSRFAQALQPDMPQTLQTSSSETFGDFDLINRVKIGFSDVTVSSWRSRVTGLNVVHLDYGWFLPGRPFLQFCSYWFGKGPLKKASNTTWQTVFSPRPPMNGPTRT